VAIGKVKKVSIKSIDLPDISKDGEYLVRYRVVSEDKNRISHWSPIYKINPEYTYVPGVIQVSITQGIATISWNAVIINKVVGTTTNFIRNASEYDVWLRWGRGTDGDWIYAERISGTSLSVPVKTTYTINGVVQESQPNRLAIEIYLKGSPVFRQDGVPLATGVTPLKMYQLLDHTV
jgi:hypothetical protein